MTTPALLISIASEYKNKSAEEIQVFLDIAETRLDEDVWGDKYKWGIVYLAAHLLTMSTRKGTSGAVVREQVGEISVSYSAPAAKSRDDQYMVTSYGTEYLAFRNTVVITPLVREST